MSVVRQEIDPRELALLERYHDGELSRLGRYRFERRLRASAPLRAELLAFQELRAGLRAFASAAPVPDLWAEIAGRLPAERPQALSAMTARRRWAPVGAALAATAAMLALFAPWPEPVPPGGVVRWVDGGGRGVVVLEATPDVTIIWLLDPAQELARPGGREGA